MNSTWRLLLCAALLLPLGACTTFLGGPRFSTPAGFAQDTRAARLVDPHTRAAGWQELLPAPPKLHFSADLTVSGSWWRGSDRFNAFYFSYRPGQQAPALRLRGYQAQLGQTLFEVLVQNGQMMALLPLQGLGFRGPIPSGGSPFRHRFGVEPWQLDQVFLIGRSLATLRFNQTDDGSSLLVEPLDTATSTTPKLVELDHATGLPRKATWAADGQQYEVLYLGWDWFDGRAPATAGAPPAPPPTAATSTAERRLMPSLLEIRRDAPRTSLRIRVSHYQFGPQVPPKIFEPYLDAPLRFQPLGGLERVLREL